MGIGSTIVEGVGGACRCPCHYDDYLSLQGGSGLSPALRKNGKGGLLHTVVPGSSSLGFVVAELGLLEKLAHRRDHGAAWPGKVARRQREPGLGTAGKAMRTLGK